MDWIKKNYDRVALILAALALLISSGLLVSSIRGFQSRFDVLQANVSHGTKLPPLENAALEKAKEAIRKSALWESHSGSLFVSRKYLVKDGNLLDPLEGGILHAPVPNQWFVENKLDMLDDAILDQDADGDGFTNLEEWSGKSDPNDKSLHPSLVAKLRLVRFIKNSFQFKFKAYDDEFFQINTLGERNTQFLKIGDPIPGTTYKVFRFDLKKIPNPSTGVDRDVSELVIQNLESGENLVLPLNRVVNSPDSYAQFKYLLDGSDLKIKKDQTFSLKVEPGIEYKLIDIQESAAILIRLKTGEEIRVPKIEGMAR